MNSKSKSLNKSDVSGFDFAKEMLCNDPTAGINFDRIQVHPDRGYIIFEYLLCEESQPYVTPFTSHPKRYWHKNSRKFLSLWKIVTDLNGTLYLVNYAKAGTSHDDEILVIEVHEMDSSGIKKETQTKYSRDDFSFWFRQLNKECLG